MYYVRPLCGRVEPQLCCNDDFQLPRSHESWMRRTVRFFAIKALHDLSVEAPKQSIRSINEGSDRIRTTEKAAKSGALLLGSVFIDSSIPSGCSDKMQSLQAIDMLNIVADTRNLSSSSNLATLCVARVAVTSNKDRAIIYSDSAQLFILSVASSV